MSKKTISTLSTILMALTLPLAQAAANAAATVPVADLSKESQATNSLKDVQAAAAAVQSEADHLKSVAEMRLSREANADSLTALREEVNQMGKVISSLNAERQYLSPTQSRALDTLVPLAQSVAANTENAIEYFDQNGVRMPSAVYQDYATHVYDDSQKIKQTLSDYLKYEKTRNQEAKLEQRVQADGE